jgi:hypothetical protein
MMAREGRPAVEETIIEEALSERELENLLIGFLEALEKEQRLGLGVLPQPAKKSEDPAGESA